MRNKFSVVLLSTVAVGGCGGNAAQLDAREGSVHDALAALGYAESGARSEASLDEGGTLQFPVRLEAGECRAFVAMGSRRIEDLEVEVLRGDGMRVARDESHGRDATAVYCATASTEVEVVVTARRGHGSVVVGSYDASAGGGSGSLGRSVGASCEAAEAIEAGTVVSGDTSLGRHVADGSCFEGGSPELFYRLEIATPSMVTLDLNSSYDGAVYILRQCGAADGEVACNDDFGGDRRHARVQASLEPGSYIVVVDGFGGERGSFQLRVDAQPLVPIAQLCADTTPITPGTAVSIDTAGGMDRFGASCANGARSAERISRLEVSERSRVRLVQRSPQHDGALYVRRTCDDETTEVACNDDWNGVDASVITRTLEPGSYFVYSDGYTGDGASSEGPVTLQADVGAASGSGVPSDACDGAELLTTGASFSVDTFAARDDLQGSCGGQGGADVVRRLRVAARSRLRVVVGAAQFNGMVYLRRGCAENAEEVMCRGFTLSTRRDGNTTMETVVDPGEYVLVVDGADVDSFGSADVQLEVTDLAAAQRACNEAPMLRSGQEVRGTTTGQPNRFEASCAAEAASGDRLYRLQLARRSFVSLTLETTDFDGALHMRRDCTDVSSEVACNDDDPDVRHSRIEGNFDAGTYYVIVDGYASASTGDFRLRADVSAYRPDWQPTERPRCRRSSKESG